MVPSVFPYRRIAAPPYFVPPYFPYRRTAMPRTIVPQTTGRERSEPNRWFEAALLRCGDQRVVVGLLLLALAIPACLRLGDRLAGRNIVEYDQLGKREAPLVVDINRAEAAELSQLPVIGPALAKRIVEHRGVHGRFRTVDDLRRVKGIGPKTLEAIRPHVSVGADGG